MDTNVLQTDVIDRSVKPLWKQVLVCLALLAFTLQTYVGLTHFHGSAAGAKEIHVSLPSDHGPDHDGADCPICTHVHLAGHFLLPGDVAATVPLVAVQIVPLALAPAILHNAVSHFWRGRGPPRI